MPLRKSTSRKAKAGEELRANALDLDPAEKGWEPTPELPRVFGGVIDLTLPMGAATLVGFVDGSTSLYTSAAGVIGGADDSVARVTRAFLLGLEAHLDEMGRDAGTDPPAVEMAVIHALTYDGRRSVVAPEDDLGYGRHPLSEVFHLAQRVVTELRRVDDQQRGSRG
jgi:hypothetical protein